jgi:hypothetical protein
LRQNHCIAESRQCFHGKIPGKAEHLKTDKPEECFRIFFGINVGLKYPRTWQKFSLINDFDFFQGYGLVQLLYFFFILE